MNKSDILSLYEYNSWANAHVLDATAGITPAQFNAPANLSHGSLGGTLVHTFGAEYVWRVRCQEGASPTALPLVTEFPTLDELSTRWRAEEQAMLTYLASLSDENLHQPVQYRSTKGVPFENVLWNVLVHVVNHGTQHRAETGIALTGYGQSPGDLDLIKFFRERAG